MKRVSFPLGGAALLALCLTACGTVLTPQGHTPIVTDSPTHLPPPVPARATPPLGPPSRSATPTPTPTPVVYIVREGDTLVSIAYTYGVTVEALQAVNGIQNPLLLQVGQRLIIPSGPSSIPTQPGLLLPTPTPLPFGVRGIGFYETPAGSLHCLGEVVNTTLYSLTNVQVRVTLFDAAGAPLVDGDAFASADILLPSARAPFSILFLSPPPGFASHQVTILRGEAAGFLAEGYVPIAVEEARGAPSGPQFEISGAVHNTDPSRTAASVVVIATTYDREGRVTGSRQQTVDVGPGLAPAGSAPFRLLLTAYGEAPADFSVIALGRTQGEAATPGG